MHCDHDRINHRYGLEILNSHGYSVSEASADLFRPNGYQNISKDNLFLRLSLP